jgi:hypothetical protein
MMRFFALLLLTMAVCHSEEDVTISVDGRFNSRCADTERSSGEALCEVSFYRLLANSEQYHERWVLLRGHLVKFLDRYVLFPNRAAFESGSDLDGVEVWVDDERENQLEGLPRSGISGYGVIGLFDAKFPGSGISRLGRLSKVRLLEPRYRIDDRPPPPPKGRSD